MKTYDTHTTRDYGTRYADALRDLATSEGHRNGMLLGTATRGLLAGRSPVEVERDLLDAGAAGRAPLTVAEVRRAVQRAEADGYGSRSYQQATRRVRVINRPGSFPKLSTGRNADEPPRPSAFMDAMTARGREYFARWRERRLSAGLREWEGEVDLSPLAALHAVSPCPLDAAHVLAANALAALGRHLPAICPPFARRLTRDCLTRNFFSPRKCGAFCVFPVSRVRQNAVFAPWVE